MSATQPAAAPLLETIRNLATFHEQHERFYSSAPLETALRLHRHARTLQALADRWSSVEPAPRPALSPYEGAEDLNSETAIALDGVLFLESGARPAEISAMIAELRADAEAFAGIGEWLAAAMQASWTMAAALLDVDGLAGVMGERHRIISNDWLSAHMQSQIAQLLDRVAEMLEHADLTLDAVRRDLSGARVTPLRLRAAAEVLSRAADLCAESAALVHDNERRWRVFRERVDEVLRTMTAPAGPAAAADGRGGE